MDIPDTENNLYYKTPLGYDDTIEIEVDEKDEGEKKEKAESDVVWEVGTFDPNNVVFYPNIRAFNRNHVINLARSMDQTGQIQDCTADVVYDEQSDRWLIRILAGQHRALAVRFANEVRKHEGREPMALRVRYANRTLEPAEILSIQISENLQNPMTPAEEAEAINLLWNEFKAVFGETASVSQLAREIGRGRGKVSDALKFMALNPYVIDLVKAGHLFYSLGVSISVLPPEQQFQAAVRIMNYDLDREGAENYIKQLLNGESFGGLFGDEELAEMKNRDHVIAFRTAADKSAKQAAGYFERILYLVGKMENPQAAEMTETIADILVSLIYSASEFQHELQRYNYNMAQVLEQRKARIVF